MKTLNNRKTSIRIYKRVSFILLIVSFSCSLYGTSPDSLRKSDNNVAIESERSLETWMTNTDLWLFAEVENENEIEEWMTDNTLWETIEQPESELEIEQWMTDNKLWDNASELELEPEIGVEDWMTDTNYFK